jgi:hypothetical protein
MKPRVVDVVCTEVGSYCKVTDELQESCVETTYMSLLPDNMTVIESTAKRLNSCALCWQ